MAVTVNQQQQQAYEAIMAFYDLAEQLIDSVEDETLDDEHADEQLALVEPLIEEIEASTDLLAEEYRNFIVSGKRPDLITKKRIENAFRNIYLALKKCKLKASRHTVTQFEHVQYAFHAFTDKFITVLDNVQKHIEKMFSVICHQMQMEFKDFHYSRSGRQEGMSLSMKPMSGSAIDGQ